tara:strand:+ start:780 stop:1688 length:909 start_codon:yes stop_codon:yes gene_type:complete
VEQAVIAQAGSTSLLRRRIRNFRYRLRRHGTAYYRVVTATLGEERVLPDFLIVGAMKSGTTSLFHYLTQHPGFCPPSTKEVHFLDNPTFYRFGESWYRSHFPTRSHMQGLEQQLGYRPVTGEATPSMVSELYAINAARHVPDARLVMVLRNPVDRAYSHYHHMRRSFFGEPLSFWDALDAEARRIDADRKRKGGATRRFKRYSYARRGMYIDQIEHWLQYFPRERLQIFSYEQLVNSPNEVCNQLCAHIGLPPMSFETDEKRNTGHYSEPMEERCRERLTELYRPYNRRLFTFLGEDWGWPS